MFTQEKLTNSQEFKDWVTGEIALIHNTYHDAKEPYQSWIVVSDENEYQSITLKDMSNPKLEDLMGRIKGSWTITRFFEMNGKIQVSVDFSDITTEEVFKVLLSKYSRGLA